MKNKELVAFYNVENLFDTVNDPDTFDDEFTPHGKKHWTEKRYENKIFKISHAIQQLSIDNNEAPFLIGLTEIENEKVLNDLIQHLPNYKYVHFDSKDERGIDVALLYKPDEFFVTHKESMYIDINQVSNETDYTRDILYVTGTYKNKTIHIFVGHLPSKRYDDINREKRIYVLQQLEKRIKEIYKKENQPAIIIFGDMNENPDKELLQENLGYTSDISKVSGEVFYNPFYEDYKEGEFSLYHKSEGMLFDQIILSPYFFNKKNELNFSESGVYDAILLKEWNPQYKDQPFRTYVGNRYLGGYSDHFPVYVVFNDPVNPLAKYIDSTYLKTAEEAEITEQEMYQKVKDLVQYAIKQKIVCAMMRPQYVKDMKALVEKENSLVHIGTVIDFPRGYAGIEEKIKEAKKAIVDGADELDFVMNYEAFKNGEIELIKDEFMQCTTLVMEEGKIIKWIIESAALSAKQIKKISKIYTELSENHFSAQLAKIFIKSSTGYYSGDFKGYSGANVEDVRLMIDFGYPLPIKASGGIKTLEEAKKYLKLGVSRIGTSSAETILNS